MDANIRTNAIFDRWGVFLWMKKIRPCGYIPCGIHLRKLTRVHFIVKKMETVNKKVNAPKKEKSAAKEKPTSKKKEAPAPPES
jgi:hypothetical protein